MFNKEKFSQDYNWFKQAFSMRCYAPDFYIVRTQMETVQRYRLLYLIKNLNPTDKESYVKWVKSWKACYTTSSKYSKMVKNLLADKDYKITLKKHHPDIDLELIKSRLHDYQNSLNDYMNSLIKLRELGKTLNKQYMASIPDPRAHNEQAE